MKRPARASKEWDSYTPGQIKSIRRRRKNNKLARASRRQTEVRIKARALMKKEVVK